MVENASLLLANLTGNLRLYNIPHYFKSMADLFPAVDCRLDEIMFSQCQFVKQFRY